MLLLDVVSKTDQRRVGVPAWDVESQDAVRLVLSRGPDSRAESGLSSALGAVRFVRSGGPGPWSGDGLPSASDPLPEVCLVGLRRGVLAGQDSLPKVLLNRLVRGRHWSAPNGVRVRIHEDCNIGHLRVVERREQVRARDGRHLDLGRALVRCPLSGGAGTMRSSGRLASGGASVRSTSWRGASATVGRLACLSRGSLSGWRGDFVHYGYLRRGWLLIL